MNTLKHFLVKNQNDIVLISMVLIVFTFFVVILEKAGYALQRENSQRNSEYIVNTVRAFYPNALVSPTSSNVTFQVQGQVYRMEIYPKNNFIYFGPIAKYVSEE